MINRISKHKNFDVISMSNDSRERVLEEDENSVTIGLQLRITNDFVMALLARSRSIEIIKPISLRQRVYNTLCDAVERNRV